jgi:hypothetical protein
MYILAKRLHAAEEATASIEATQPVPNTVTRSVALELQLSQDKRQAAVSAEAQARLEFQSQANATEF